MHVEKRRKLEFARLPWRKVYNCSIIINALSYVFCLSLSFQVVESIKFRVEIVKKLQNHKFFSPCCIYDDVVILSELALIPSIAKIDIAHHRPS